MSVKRCIVILLCLVLLGVPAALAQGVRSLGMGGVTTPGSAAGANPAYAALPGDGVSIPLPLGLLNALLNERFDFNSKNFDLLSVFDQATHLGTFLFNPAQSPEEVIVSVRSENGVPVLALDMIGGSTLLATQGVPVAYRQRLELPINFDIGVLNIGLRPYLKVSGRVTPDDSFREVFGAGTSKGSVAFSGEGEAGVSLDVVYATALPLPKSDAFPGTVYLGVRAAPFLGLARLDGQGEASLAAVANAEGELEFEYTVGGEGFFSSVTEGKLGYGLRGDVGAVVVVPTPQGRLTAGLGVQNLGVSFWSGRAFISAASSDSEAQVVDSHPASRRYFADDIGVSATLAYDFDLSRLGASEFSSLLVAADGSYSDGVLSTHLGGEAGFDVGFGELLARAGLGYDSGLVFGVGAGLRLAGVGLDMALHSYRSPFTAHQAFGVSAGLSFGF